jgi:hypothetical protein
MKTRNAAMLLCAMPFVLLAACQKQPEPKTAAPAAPPSASVAAPPSQTPPSDASIPPATPPGKTSSGDAATPTQANPSTLTKEQEQASMPHTGQTNTHSSPETVGEKKQ